MGKNYLFAIAIDKYASNKIIPLNNAVQDTEKLVEVLTRKYSFEIGLESLYNECATRKNIIDKLNDLSFLVTKEDSLFIYFAGHGDYNGLTQKGYWVSYDSGVSLSDYVPNSTVVDILSGFEAKHILLVIDSCFSGSFLSQMRSSNEMHYRELHNSKSRWVITSGRNEKVSDGKVGKGSPFAIILTEFFNKNSSFTFSVGELAVAISKSVGSISNQQPLFGFINELGHEGGQFVFNLGKSPNEEAFNSQDELNKIVISYDTAKMLRQNGMQQESIFGYYQLGDKIILKKKDTNSHFDCSAFTYEELTQFIPEEIAVDPGTYIARFDGYDELGEPEEGMFDYASVTFQRTETIESPFMAICKCRGRMVAFSKTKDGYNNLIAWGKNQAESAALIWKLLKDENKV